MPRLVKEAEALAEAGYEVRVVACREIAWAKTADRALTTGSRWRLETVGRFTEGTLHYRSRQVGEKFCRLWRGLVGDGPRLTPRAYQRNTTALFRAAARKPAALYLAHNLAALPAAVWAAERHGAKAGFDCEDFHSGQTDCDPPKVLAMSEYLERLFLPRCAHLTAATDGVAEAYAKKYGLPRPKTVLNVFPLSAAEPPRPTTKGTADTAADREYRRPHEGGLSLYWFSQTVGPRRGLEDAARAAALVEGDVHLCLRGRPDEEYVRRLRNIMDEAGRADRLHLLPLVPPNEVVRAAAAHEVGLALETPVSVNRDVTLSNKFFAYLAAGLAVAASATKEQRALTARIPEAGALYEPGDYRALAAILQEWHDDPVRLRAARKAARRAAEKRYNWEREKEVLLEEIRRHVGRR